MSEFDFPNKATPVGSTAYYAVRFSRPELHNQLAALFQFKYELEKLTGLSDPGVARLKLQWWKEQLSKTNELSSHPLASSIGRTIQSGQIPLQNLLSMMDEKERHIRRISYEDFNDFWQGCLNFGGAFALLLHKANLIEPTDKTSLQGAWITLIESISTLGSDLRNGICLLPNAELKNAGLDKAQLLHADNKTLSGLLNQLTQIPDQSVIQGRPQTKTTLSKYLKLRHLLLKQLKKDEFPVLHQHTSLSPLIKLWHAWR